MGRGKEWTEQHTDFLIAFKCLTTLKYADVARIMRDLNTPWCQLNELDLRFFWKHKTGKDLRERALYQRLESGVQLVWDWPTVKTFFETLLRGQVNIEPYLNGTGRNYYLQWQLEAASTAAQQTPAFMQGQGQRAPRGLQYLQEPHRPYTHIGVDYVAPCATVTVSQLNDLFTNKITAADFLVTAAQSRAFTMAPYEVRNPRIGENPPDSGNYIVEGNTFAVTADQLNDLYHHRYTSLPAFLMAASQTLLAWVPDRDWFGLDQQELYRMVAMINPAQQPDMSNARMFRSLRPDELQSGRVNVVFHLTGNGTLEEHTDVETFAQRPGKQRRVPARRTSAKEAKPKVAISPRTPKSKVQKGHTVSHLLRKSTRKKNPR